MPVVEQANLKDTSDVPAVIENNEMTNSLIMTNSMTGSNITDEEKAKFEAERSKLYMEMDEKVIFNLYQFCCCIVWCY